MQPRLAQRAERRHGVAGKLRQRLAAEARAAGAEPHHVGGVLLEQPRIAEDRRDVVALFRQAKQRQRAVGVTACAARASASRRCRASVAGKSGALGEFDRLLEHRRPRAICPVSFEVRVLGPPDHRHQHAAVGQPLGDAARVLDRHGVDQAVALVDVVDAEILDLDLQELAGDLGRGVEAQRERALEVVLRLGELLLGRAFARHAADFRLDQLERLAGAVVAGLRAAGEQRGAVERQEIRRHAVGQAALLTHLGVEPRRERAAAEDVVDHERRDEVRDPCGRGPGRRTTAPPAARRGR